MSLAALARHLRSSQQAIIERWEGEVRRDPGHVPSARRLAEPQLRDHLPMLLDDMCRVLEDRDEGLVEAEGREHGRQRWDHGYEITELLRELAVLRRVLVAVVHECPGLTSEERAEGLGRTLDILDRSAQTSAAQYHAEALAAHEALEEKLRSADEQKDRFLAILAHELRNPLAGIQSALHLFRLRSDDPLLAQPLARADRQLRRMDRLIGDLLDISRISEGKLELRPQRLDLAGLIRETSEEHRAALSEVDLILTLELPPEPVWARGDPIRLAQVLDNLLTNAIKFTDPGGEVTVRLTVEAESRRAALSIRDNGIGLDPEILPLVFDPFAQADRSQERSRGGLGMGLALVKGLIDLHGGEIGAHSDGPGRGTEFTLRLPLEPRQPDSASSQ